jgi:hypothetical protein
MTISYEDWSDNFKTLKDLKSPTQFDIDQVIKFYRDKHPPAESLRKHWNHDLGFRKNVADGTDRGEQEIERLLIGPRGEIKEIQIENPLGRRKSLKVRVSDHNFPFSAFRRGQVISDAFGYHESGRDFRPVAIEVKVRNGSPWLAVVENLIQVCLARYNLKTIEERGRKLRLVTKALPHQLESETAWKVRGAWGLVVAPEQYYHHSTYGITKKLIEQLKRQTMARIMLTKFDKTKEGTLDWLAGYWPS